MKLPSISLIVLLLTTSGDRQQCASAFRVGNEGNAELMKKSVEDALKIAPHKQQDVKPPLRNELLGTEVPCPFEYWERPDIHTFGNMKLGGGFHAAMAPIATKIIDMKAYGGVDVRKCISEELRVLVNKTNARVADLCCGVGMSTRALESAFHDAEMLVGIDTSPQMISMAEAITGHEYGIRAAMDRHVESVRRLLEDSYGAFADALAALDVDPYPEYRSSSPIRAAYQLGNAEMTGLPDKSLDLVTIMYSFHEVPREGRNRIIQEARRLLKKGGHIAILDICPTYTPSPHMLAGEPFVIEYQSNIDEQLASLPGLNLFKRKTVVPGHVNMWLLEAA